MAMTSDAPLGGGGDDLLGHRTQRLGFGLGRHQVLSRYQRGDQVSHHRLLMGRATAEPAALLRGAEHADQSLTRRARPRSSSFWSTSSSDFCPKLVMFNKSSSVRSTNSPMVLICARLRQLRGCLLYTSDAADDLL